MTIWKRVLLALLGLSLVAFFVALGWRATRRRGEPVEPVPVAVLDPTATAALPSPTLTLTLTPTPSGTPTPAEPTLRFLVPFAGSQPRPATPTPTITPTSEPTPVPSPTPTPTVPWPPPLSEPSRSKLGLHVQWNNSPEIMEFVRRMLPAVIKPVGELGFVAEVKEASPQTIVVARLSHLQPMDGDPEAMARAFVAAHLHEYLRHPDVDYWEGYNEPDVSGRMAWYARFEAERVRAMAEHGLKTAIGGFSTGVPEWEDFEAFLPAIRAAKQHGGILTLHEYDAPLMDRAFGAGLPGHPNHPDRGALTMRYRWWYEDFLIPRGLVIPLVISEAGVDGLVSNRPGPLDAHGWLDFKAYWAEAGLGGNPLEVYLPQLEWYDRELQKDDYVIGWAVFTAGAMNPDWKSYDVTDYLRHIAARIIVPNAR
jgi:hypothetical protein